MKSKFRLPTFVAVLGFGVALSWPAAAFGDPQQTFDPTFPFRVSQDATPLSKQAIRAAIVNKTRYDIDVLDRYYFFEDGRFHVQPMTPPPGKPYAYAYWGKWNVTDDNNLCLSLETSSFAFLDTSSRCFKIYDFNRMILGASAEKPGNLQFLWNGVANVRMPLMADQQEFFLTSGYPRIIAAERAGDKEAPSTDVDKWNAPADPDMLAIQKYFENGGKINQRDLHFSHQPDGTLTITSDGAPGQVVHGRWWMSGRLYCTKYSPSGIPPRTFCYGTEVLAPKPGAEGIRVKPDEIGFFGRAILALPVGAVTY